MTNTVVVKRFNPAKIFKNIKRIIAAFVAATFLFVFVSCETIVVTGIIPAAIGWIFFWDNKKDGESDDVFIERVVNDVGDLALNIGKSFLDSLVDKKQIKIFGKSISIPFVSVKKAKKNFENFSLDPIEFCANFGAMYMEANPNATEDDLKKIKEQYFINDTGDIEKFLFNEENVANSYLIQTETYIYTKTDGTVLTEADAQSLQEQVVKDSEELEILKQSSNVDITQLKEELKVLNSDLITLQTELENLTSEITQLRNDSMEAGKAGKLDLYNELEEKIKLKGEEKTQKEEGITAKESEISTKELEISTAENREERIKVLETSISENAITLTVEIEYAPNPNSPYDKSGMVQAAITFLKEIIFK